MNENIRNLLLPPPVIVVGIGLLAGWIVYETSQDSVMPTVPTAEITNTTGMENVVVELAPILHNLTDLSEISDRALFAQKRSPWQSPEVQVPVDIEPAPVVEAQEPTPPPPPPRPETPAISLLGVMKNDQITRALVLDQRTDEETWIVVGDTLADWEVVEIDSSGLILRAQGEEFLVSYNR